MFLLGGILVVCIMQIILNDFGSFLGKKGDRFVVKNGDKKEEFAVGNIDQILVAASSGFSTIGSPPKLNEVFNTTGIPVRLSKFFNKS